MCTSDFLSSFSQAVFQDCYLEFLVQYFVLNLYSKSKVLGVLFNHLKSNFSSLQKTLSFKRFGEIRSGAKFDLSSLYIQNQSYLVHSLKLLTFIVLKFN